MGKGWQVTPSLVHALIHVLLIGTMNLPSKRQIFPAVLLAISFAGCGSHSDRLEVTGTVKLNGAPLDEGSIRLTSVGAEKLFASGAIIQNGEFTVPQEKGLPPGTYAVEISSPDANAPLVRPRAAPGEPILPPTAPERIPAEYNSQSKHTIEVSADSDNHFEFDIQSRAST